MLMPLWRPFAALCTATAVDSRYNSQWRQQTGSCFSAWFPMCPTCFLGGFRQSENGSVDYSHFLRLRQQTKPKVVTLCTTVSRRIDVSIDSDQRCSQVPSPSPSPLSPSPSPSPSPLILKSSSPSPSPSPQVSLSFNLPPRPKKRQNLTVPCHLTTSTEVCLNEVRNTFYKCLWSHSLQSTQQIKHLAAWLFNVNNNFISVSGWLHVHFISIAFEKHNI